MGTDQQLKVHQFNGQSISKNGYLYIYVSNETPNVDVFFDNLQITHVRGPVLEETHYYPFGLTMTGISCKSFGNLVNRTKFNGIEHTTELNMNHYDAFYRNADPQIARWWQTDPKPNVAESPYSMIGNNPLRYSDPLGDSIKIDLEGSHNGIFTLFAHTKAGKRFLSKYAQKGQTIAGITFKKDGKYHKKGIDLNYDSKDLPGGISGRTNKSVDANGRAQINISLNTDKSLSKKENRAESFMTIFHESFIHAEMNARDFYDNNKFDYSNISSKVKDNLKGRGWFGDDMTEHYHHHQVAFDRKNVNSGHLWPTDALEGLKEINKKQKFWGSVEEIVKEMWKYNGGLTDKELKE